MKSTRLIVMGLCAALSTTAFAEDAKKADPPAATAPAGDVPAEVKAGTGVEKHEVPGEAATSPAGTTVWVWSRVTGAEGSVKHVWKRDGQPVWTATLAVGSKKW